MTRRLLPLLPLAIALLGATGCSNDASPTSPTPPATVTKYLEGTWTGTVTTPNGEGTVRMTLQSRIDGGGEFASGTYELRAGPAFTSGEVTGLQALGIVSILLTPPGPPRCPVDAPSASAGSLLFGGRPNGNRLSGTGTWIQCGVSTEVPVVLTKP
jgi:hypothetical protein